MVSESPAQLKLARSDAARALASGVHNPRSPAKGRRSTQYIRVVRLCGLGADVTLRQKRSGPRCLEDSRKAGRCPDDDRVVLL